MLKYKLYIICTSKVHIIYNLNILKYILNVFHISSYIPINIEVSIKYWAMIRIILLVKLAFHDLYEFLITRT